MEEETSQDEDAAARTSGQRAKHQLPSEINPTQTDSAHRETELAHGVSRGLHCSHAQAAHSLGMFLVDGAIHADGGAKSLLALVLFDAPQDRSQGGCAQAGRARGHNLADSLCGHAVLLQRTQTQTHQDLVGLP